MRIKCNIDAVCTAGCLAAAALAFHGWPDPLAAAFGGWDIAIAYWCFGDWMKSKVT